MSAGMRENGTCSFFSCLMFSFVAGMRLAPSPAALSGMTSVSVASFCLTSLELSAASVADDEEVAEAVRGTFPSVSGLRELSSFDFSFFVVFVSFFGDGEGGVDEESLSLSLSLSESELESELLELLLLPVLFPDPRDRC